MKVSLNTLKQFVDLELPPINELVAKINAQLGGVEEVIDLGAKYKDALIVVVAKCEKHPNADKLSVCMIDDGGMVQNVERDEYGLIQVVCGAPNVHGGMLAVWLPPGSTVPSTYDDKQPFELGSRELRGVTSNGMLAAADELAIGDDHEGIVEVTEYDMPAGIEKNDELIGKSFAEVFDLDDYIIDIENKMFTHRPDCFGQLGVAREVSAILQPEPDRYENIDNRFNNPQWYWNKVQFADCDGLKLDVFNDEPKKVPRFLAVALKNVEVKPSPLWLQATLARWGSKSINNVVDITNYIMLLTAQPTHAYDYDKLHGSVVGARMAKSGETVTLLNAKTYDLSEDDIVIADGEGAIGLAGIMGGGNSEVSTNTKNIVLEVASFDMYTLRRSAMRYGLFTDALARFNKGQSTLQNDRVMKHLIDLMHSYASAEQASAVYDKPSSDSLDMSTMHGEMKLEASFINERLGLNLTTIQIGNVLRSANFAVYQPDDGVDVISVTAPFWRTDIELPEDIVEEVGRLYGFDKLPRELPKRSMSPTPKSQSLVAKRAIRSSLKRAGANEVLSYSFVHEKLLQKAEQDPEQAFKISNALSPDLQYYRLSVLPSLLDKVHANIKAGQDEFTIYEIGKGHNKSELGEDGLPREINYVDAVYASKQDRQGAAYYYVRTLLDQLARDLGFVLKFKPVPSDTAFQVTAPFEPSRSALAETNEGLFIGVIGELKQSVKENFKLPKYTAAVSLDFNNLKQAYYTPRSSYKPLSRYPSTRQDISLKVASGVGYGDMLATVCEVVDGNKDLDSSVELLSIYQPQDSADSLTYTFRITAVSHQRTLTDDDLSQLMKLVEQEAANKHQAARI